MEIPFNTVEFVLEHWNLEDFKLINCFVILMKTHLLRKAFPNLDRGLNCFLGSTTRAFPGITPSLSAFMTAINLEN